MTETTSEQVRDAERGFFPSGKASGFTKEEREEIIFRLQAVENLCTSLSVALGDIQSALYTTVEQDDGTVEVIDRVDGIYGFCQRLGVVLDALGSNPMFAAMLPPDAFEEGTGD
jgi:hypothetical protein